ncbi:MAG: phosphatidylglycerol lysyltransferase domain-containing protein, partial [Desulfobacterales bacterium]|nr:phosphatidylglycerol lysyltransferase domain-containing protein [Desulfobacterales bacterium]
FPVGPGDKRRALETLCRELGNLTPEVRICRVGEASVTHDVDADRYTCLPDRDNSDYVYLSKDLVNLSGRKYHRKRNHRNQFLKNCEFEYRSLDTELVECVLEMQAAWCRMRECVENPDLLAEDYAIYEALTRFEDLDYQGGAILINTSVEAFSLGERLNPDTAVIHIEKANPEIPGLYAAINQRFCQEAWSDVEYINREQDLGLEGLRAAKESYYPCHMVNKYTVMPK